MEEHAIKTLSEVWDLKGYWTKQEKEEQGKEKEAKGERGEKGKEKKAQRKSTGKVTANKKKKYEPHPEDKWWQGGGKGRVKFVADNQVLANIVSGKKKITESPLSVVFRRVTRAFTTLIQLKYLPFKDTGEYVYWRKRDFNKQADHIANVTLDTQRGQFHCDKTALREAKSKKANLLIFPTGGTVIVSPVP